MSRFDDNFIDKVKTKTPTECLNCKYNNEVGICDIYTRGKPYAIIDESELCKYKNL